MTNTCSMCNKKITAYAKTCRDCANKLHSKRMRGSRNPKYKGGKPNCIKCGKELSAYHLKYCSRCSYDNRTKEGHTRWSGGKYISPEGYVLVYHKKRKYIFEHRLVSEQMLGRDIKQSEVVHHINGIKTDNRESNLLVMTRKEHNSLHKDIRNEHKA